MREIWNQSNSNLLGFQEIHTKFYTKKYQTNFSNPGEGYLIEVLFSLSYFLILYILGRKTTSFIIVFLR